MNRPNTRGRKERERLGGGSDRKGDDAHASLEKQVLEHDQNNKGVKDASSEMVQKERKLATRQLPQQGKAQSNTDSIQEISFVIQLQLEEFKLEKGCILQVQKSQERPFHNLQLCQKIVNESFEPMMLPLPHPPLSDSESIELVILPPKQKPLIQSQSESVQLIVQKKSQKSNKRIRKVPKTTKKDQKSHFPTKNPQKKHMKVLIETSTRTLRSKK